MDAFITDPVYEGKSLAGMIEMVRKEEIRAGEGEVSTNGDAPASIECVLGYGG
jgi:hypothetical protein